ncbi:TOMM precursor leader peptide-binding protein [Micromonospora peucetia]|uniref:Bacteriocin biosynthesis cyclodehydratase domain-containing protein n=1 Tax=Micromonospora peucetia TaxID=47871 RepID=A0A1C6V3S3_9ACTN|nr:TOMM precursor leader peptide-binding protein [Micromonospora peucetia]WSA35317.1 TOMM precursor leader peptide-binding protein [Micromonospora peucetia]SCL60885.1 bacteriocin biosynthesis cyclodehydratase domain-containing protein [Micromonospora peucetia]
MGEVTLRPGSLVRAVEGGLLVSGWRSSSVVTCPPVVGELWRRLEPLLRRGLDPGTATLGLSDGTAKAVRWLLGLLADHDVLIDVRVPLGGHPLAACLAGLAQNPADALDAVSRSTVTVAGDGDVPPAVRAALTTSGVSTGDDVGADLVVWIRTENPGEHRKPPVPPWTWASPQRLGPSRPAVLPVTIRPDGVLIGPLAGAGHPAAAHWPTEGADDDPAGSARARRLLPFLVAHEVVRTVSGLADGTALLLRGAGVHRVGVPTGPDGPRPRPPAVQIGPLDGAPAPGTGPAARAASAHPPVNDDTTGNTGPPGPSDADDGPVRVIGNNGRLVRAVAIIASTGRRRTDQPIVVGVATDWPVARHLAEQRAAHATGRAYLPVRARGTAIEIGPLSSPGVSGCLQCADTRHQAVLGAGSAATLLADGRPLPLPPYWRGLIGELVAGQLADDADPRTTSVLSVRDGSISRHLIRALPDCPACGALPPDSASAATIALRPRRQPAPDRFRARPEPPDLAMLRAELVDFRYGPVTHVHVDRQGPLALSAAELPVPGRSGRLGGYGRAADQPTAQVLALLEAVEREAGRCPQTRRTTTLGSYRELAADAVDPARLGLPEPDAVRHPGYRLAPFTPDTVTSWVWAYDLAGDRPVLVPEHAAYYGVDRAGAARFLYESSSGCAVGGCLEEAILYACLETIERDAFLLTWYAGRTPPALALPPDVDPLTRYLADRIAAEGYTLHLLDVTSDIGIPAVWALAVTDHPDRTDRGATFSAAGAHPDPRRAAAAAVLEVGVNVAVAPKVARPPRDRLLAMLADPDLVRELGDHAALYLLPQTLSRFDFTLRDAAAGPARPFDEHFAGWRDRWLHPDLTEVLRRVVDAMASAGTPPLVVDQTGAAERRLDLAAVKVLAPGAVPMTFGHLNRRVDLPRLRQARLAAPDHLILPHPFP